MQQPIIFDREHSVRACVSDAWRILATNWHAFLKCTWAGFLIASLALSLLFELALQYVCAHLIPAVRFTQSGGDPQIGKLIAIPGILTALYLLVAVLMSLVCVYLCEGRVIRVINEYRAQNAMPSDIPQFFAKEEGRFALRLFAVDVAWGVVLLALGAVIAIVSVKVSYWILVAFPPLFIYVWTSAHIARLRHALAGRSFAVSMRFGFRHGLGQMFIVQILTIIPAFVIAPVFLMPSAIYALGMAASADSMLRGDVTVVQNALPLLFFLLNTICFSVLMTLGAWRTWALGMKCCRE